MITIQFLAEWALRSSILILSGALLLRALRVKDASIRLAAWTAVLCGSLAIPALTAALPKIPLAAMRVAAGQAGAQAVVYNAPLDPAVTASPTDARVGSHGAGVSKRFDWARAGTMAYVLVALALLLRLSIGLAMSLRLLRGSRATGRATEGIEIRESDGVATPVTLGIVRPAIVLPGDWRHWDGAKLEAVLAHERSHILRHDPAVQLLSAIHRALLWHSPLSWFLRRRIVRVAEEASDDAAVAVTADRALYAEVLLDFMQRGVHGPSWQGVPMARYGRADERIRRILEGTALSRGVTRWSLAAILAIGSPLAYVVAAAQPQAAEQAQTAPRQQSPEEAKRKLQAAVNRQQEQLRQLTQQLAGRQHPDYLQEQLRQLTQQLQVMQQSIDDAKTAQAEALVQSKPAAKPEPAPVYLNGLGNVAAFYTVTVKPRVDGQLTSVSFKEGEMVHEGRVLATIDPQLYQVQVEQAAGQLAKDQAALNNARAERDRIRGLVAQNAVPKTQLDAQDAALAAIEGTVRTDEASVERAKLQLTYAQIVAPITGVAGLRLVDPGNMVHASDSTGIVIITQLQPIAVVFQIPEDSLPQVRARLSEGASLPVEAWNRDLTVKLATGLLTAVDNQIDMTTGTAKLKAVFDNKDGALFPNQFVNVRMLMNGR
jgi:RND family efflux transporter MFP subunit